MAASAIRNMSSHGLKSPVVAKSPAVKSIEEPGRKNPKNTPDSKKTTAKSPG